MGQYSSYYLYQKYEKRGEQDWIPCYPNTFSMSGDTEHPMPFVEKSSADTACGYVPCETEERWTEIPITEDYECGECEVGYQYRYVSCDVSAFTYIGDYKYEILCEQRSTDGGLTWEDTNNTKISDTPIGEVGKKVTITMRNGDVFAQSCGNEYGFWNECSQTPEHSSSSAMSLNKTSYHSPYYYVQSANQKTSNSLDKPNGYYILTCSSNVKSIVFGECVEKIGYDKSVGTSVSDTITLIGGNHSGWYMDSVTFPQSLKAIGASAFKENSFTSISIPSGVTELGWYAFSTNQFLSDVQLNEGLLSIGYYCFEYCRLLQKIEIPSTVTEIWWHTFQNSTGLLQVIFKGSTPPKGCYPTSTPSGSVKTIGKMKLNVPSDCKIYVPCGSKSAYDSAFEDISTINIIEYGGNCPNVPSLASQYRPLYTYKKNNMTNTFYKGSINSGGQTVTSADVPRYIASTSVEIDDSMFDEVIVYYGNTVNSGTIRSRKITYLGGNSAYTDSDSSLIVFCGTTYCSSVNPIGEVVFGSNSDVYVNACFNGMQASSITFNSHMTLHTTTSSGCFTDCHLLTDIYITYTGGIIPLDQANYNHPPFEDSPVLRVHVPCELYDGYKAHSIWGQFNIVKNSEECGQQPHTEIIETSAVTLSSHGSVYTYSTTSTEGYIVIDCYDQDYLDLIWKCYADGYCTLKVYNDGILVDSLAVRYDSGSGEPKMKEVSTRTSIGSGYHRVELVYKKHSGGAEIKIGGF